MFITGRYNGYPQAIDLDKITRVYVNENNEITVDGLSNTAERLYGIWEINGEELDVGDVAHRTMFMSYIVDYMASKFRKTAIVCDEPGINGRSYPLEIIRREVDKLNRTKVCKGRLAAELNHPRLESLGEQNIVMNV